MANSLLFENKQLTTTVQESQKLQVELGAKNIELEHQVNESKTALKQYGQQLHAMKMNEQKLRLLVGEAEGKIGGKDEEIGNLRNEIMKLRAENTENGGMIN